MNAYELADEAYKKATTRFDYDVALTMKQLIQENSQQADRIAELEKECADWEKAFIKAIQESHVIK